MNLESTVESILKKNPSLKHEIAEHPELKEKLLEMVKESYEDNKYLIKWAEFNDKVGRILGPLEAGLRYFSALGTPGFGVYSATKLAHYALLKLPFTVYYAAKTHDLGGAGALTLAEIAKYVVPFGTVGDIFPLYQKVMDRYVINKSTQKLEDYISSLESERQPKLTLIERGIRIPQGLKQKYNARIEDNRILVDVPSRGYELNLAEQDDGTHQVYVTKRRGVHPNVLTTLEMELPENATEITVHRKGLFKDAQAA